MSASVEDAEKECPYCHSYVGRDWTNCMLCGLDLYKYKYILKTDDERYVYVQTNREKFARKAEETKRQEAEKLSRKAAEEARRREDEAARLRAEEDARQKAEERDRARREQDENVEKEITRCAEGLGMSLYQVFDFLRKKYGACGQSDSVCWEDRRSKESSCFWAAGFFIPLVMGLLAVIAYFVLVYMLPSWCEPLCWCIAGLIGTLALPIGLYYGYGLLGQDGMDRAFRGYLTIWFVGFIIYFIILAYQNSQDQQRRSPSSSTSYYSSSW